MRKQCGLWVLIIVSSGAWSHIKAQRLEPRPQSSSTPPGTVLVAAASLPGPESWPVGKVLTTESEQERRIRTGLEQPLTHDFTGMKLADLAPLLEERLKCTVVFDRPAMSADGMEPEKVELGGKAPGRSLRKELRGLLDPRRLQSIVRDDCLCITTQTAAELETSLRIYQVHDLVVMPGDKTVDEPQLDQLRDLIQWQISPESWPNGGGAIGNLYGFESPGVLAIVVTHTDEVHERIEELLAQLRNAKLEDVTKLQLIEPVAVEPLVIGRHGIGPKLPPPPRMPRGMLVDRVQNEAEQRIYEALRKPTKFDFRETRLDAVAAFLQKQHEIPVMLDERALIADGKGAEWTLSFRVKGASLGAALRLMLDYHGLAWNITDDALRITTKTAAETVEVTRVYQVHDLLAEA